MLIADDPPLPSRAQPVAGATPSRDSHGRCGGRPERELGSVEVVVLDSVLVHLSERHRVPKIRVPSDREVHPTGQCLLGLAVEAVVQHVDGLVEVAARSGPSEHESAAARAKVVDGVEGSAPAFSTAAKVRLNGSGNRPKTWTSDKSRRTIRKPNAICHTSAGWSTEFRWYGGADRPMRRPRPIAGSRCARVRARHGCAA